MSDVVSLATDVRACPDTHARDKADAITAFGRTINEILLAAGYSDACRALLIGEITDELTELFAARSSCGSGGSLNPKNRATQKRESVKLSTRPGKGRERGRAEPSKCVVQP